MSIPIKDIQPSESHVMKLRVSKDDVRLDFVNEETLLVKSSDAPTCEKTCLQEPRCKVAMFDTTDSSCLLKMIPKDAWLVDGNMDKIEVNEKIVST